MYPNVISDQAIPKNNRGSHTTVQECVPPLPITFEKIKKTNHLDDDFVYFHNLKK